jgi:pimeloyl-ACP methyl ester carboxylesterase
MSLSHTAPPVAESPPSQLEFEWVGDAASPVTMVFLHEGLGSAAMWKDFPAALCAACNVRGLVYSRAGYGNSPPRFPNVDLEPDFMHVQACEALPALLESLGIKAPVWLFGHSDGASIALIYASSFPDATLGVVALAPHVFVEPLALSAIAQTREAFLTTHLRERLARFHTDVDGAFWGWNNIWLSPHFASWNIEPLLVPLRCPLLVIQGEQDEYGTMAQLEHISQHAPHAELFKLNACGHSPHRDQRAAVIARVSDFMACAADLGKPIKHC